MMGHQVYIDSLLGEELIKRAGLLSMGLGALEGVGVKSRATVSRPSMQEVLILLWELFDINRVSRLRHHFLC